MSIYIKLSLDEQFGYLVLNKSKDIFDSYNKQDYRLLEPASKAGQLVFSNYGGPSDTCADFCLIYRNSFCWQIRIATTLSKRYILCLIGEYYPSYLPKSISILY